MRVAIEGKGNEVSDSGVTKGFGRQLVSAEFRRKGMGG